MYSHLRYKVIATQNSCFDHCKAFDDIKSLHADGRDATALDGALEIPGQRSVAASTVVLISEKDPHY